MIDTQEAEAEEATIIMVLPTVNRNRTSFEFSTDDPSLSSSVLYRKKQSITDTPLFRKSAFLLVCIVVIWFFNEDANNNNNNKNNRRKHHNDDHDDDDDDEDLHKIMTSTGGGNNYCIDPDDTPEEKELLSGIACNCIDPTLSSSSLRNNDNLAAWALQHEKMIQDVKYATTEELKNGHELDFVLLGDSLVERWNGTKGLGREWVPEYREVFERYFDKDENHHPNQEVPLLQGMALGSAGDTTNELLWHLQNGILPEELNPKLFVILIGTNNVGTTFKCSKRTALAGILQVAHYIHTRKPDIPILIHGLLPRSDHYGEKYGDYSLGTMWDKIMWINRELKRFCSLKEDWYYTDASNLFLQRIVDSTRDTEGALQLKSQIMKDALHPDVEGYELWAPKLAKDIQKIIQ